MYLLFPSEWHVAKSKMEACILDIRRWLKWNCLKLNDGKTEMMIVGQNSLTSRIEGSPELSIGNTKVKPTETVRNIGAVFDAEMKMCDQVSSVCKASYANLHSLGRIRKYLDDASAKTLVHAFITCRIDNLNSLLVGTPKYAKHKLQMVLNNAARLITKTDHITSTLVELHWLPVNARIDYKILLFTYKALNDLGPAYISNMLHFKQHKRDTRSSSDVLLLDPPTTNFITWGDRAFAFNAVKQWNILPLELRSSQTLSAFKKDLKTFLFKRSYPNHS